ncbi:putative purine permease 11 [Cinnamomum micranthum f. kanehirae]|uniref:Probable purine permease n=1 Tax=Cinnamomum micranthum f. kanehirae TaxID=337451 RepID=A0A443P9A1_9MAGN|nr:putative purine permease 11 [Cinnamomum micranthum f. kanehirae]
MGEIQEVQLCIKETKEPSSPKDASATHQPLSLKLRKWQWQLLAAISIIFVLAGQSVGTLLGRFYFNEGGNSKWVATLVQSAAFPILLIPLYFISSPTTRTPQQPSLTTLSFIYIFIGLVVVAAGMMYSYGLLYLPVSTYSLICATQLGFNAIFSYFINSQKLTPYILNSVVLLTFSASLLGVQSDSTNHKPIPKGEYAIGFVCTLGASALYSLLLSLTQLAFQKVLKKETLSVILEIQIYPSAVATCAGLVGLFASGDWKDLKGEMEGFREGKVSYVMTLVWTAVSWQVFSVGSLFLIYEVSSLFCNVIGTVGLPVIPILAVVFFHDKMDGVKIVAMLLAVWGFLSYIYQHYLDDSKSRRSRSTGNEVDKKTDTST